MGKFVDFFKRGILAFENALMPEYSCLVCGRECRDTDLLICDDCKNTLIEISGHVCEKCGMPIPENVNVCDDCKFATHFFDKARAAYVFDAMSSKIVYRLKYYGNKFAAKHIARMLVAPMCDFGKIDFFVPVPLHEKRLKERGYNQSFLIANELSELTSIPVKNDVLIRKIETETQTGMSKTERAANVVGAFSVANKKAVVCKNIVLVDDVFTTGATTDECARVLKRAGASRVYVLTALKTVSSMSHTGKTKRKKR